MKQLFHSMRPVFLAAFVSLALLQPAVAVENNTLAPHLIPSAEPHWPQFRGPRRDGICDEKGLLQSWPEGGPELLWTTTNLGRGYSSPIIVKDRLFITGDVGPDLRITAMDLKGSPVWRATNGASWTRDYPGARASVTFSNEKLYHENAHGRVVCLDALSSKELWSVDLLAKFRGENIAWGMSENLLVDSNLVYATAGGADALLVALDRTTGEIHWKSEPLFDSEGQQTVESASYVSPILAQFGAQRLLIGCSLKHLYCADAETGKIQWTRRRPTSYGVLAMMPTLVGNAVFITAPHGKPGTLYRLLPPAEPGKPVGVEDVWDTRLDTCQGGVVFADGKLFGSFYSGRKGWAAVDAKTGAVLYDGPDFVKGAALHADNRLYALCEDGTMLMLQLGENQFEVKGRFRLVTAERRDAWAHPVIHHGRLYLRYHETLYCYDVRRAEN